MRLLKEARSMRGSYYVKSGIYHYYRNEFKQAVDFLRRALADASSVSESDRKTARFYLTETFLASAGHLERKGDLEAAARDYARASEVEPNFPDIRFRRGRVLQHLGRYDEAIAEYRIAVQCNPEYLDARVALGFCLLRHGRHSEAAEAFEDALVRKVRQVREPCERGLDRLSEGRAGEAEVAFHAAFLQVPHRFEDLYGAALEHLKAEEYDDAVEKLQGAIDLDPNCPDLHNFRGVALCELGRVEEGIESFRRSLDLKPDYQVAELNLAFSHLRLGRLKEAQAHLEAILARDPSQPTAAAKLAELGSDSAQDPRQPVSRGGTR